MNFKFDHDTNHSFGFNKEQMLILFSSLFMFFFVFSMLVLVFLNPDPELVKGQYSFF